MAWQGQGKQELTKLTRKKVCQTCGGDDFMRYHRSLWMRLFSRSQFFRCRQCRSTILLLRDLRRSEATDYDEI